MSTQTPREIAFEDIRAGDRLRMKLAEEGIEFTREGVAHKNAHGGWYTSKDGFLVAAGSTATITLLRRPVPAEPKGLGAVVRARVAEAMVGRLRACTLVRTAGRDHPWIEERGYAWAWPDLDPGSIEVLSEGIEVES